MIEFEKFQKRIKYSGEVVPLLEKVSRLYEKGAYKSHKVVTTGYEDFNVVLEASTGKFFLKLFADSRDKSNCLRYVGIMERAIEGGVKHPALFRSKSGYLGELNINGETLYLCLMEYIDGDSFFDLETTPTPMEVTEIIAEAIKINRIDYRPDFDYDSWSVTVFAEELDKVEEYLDPEDRALIAPLKEEFSQIIFDELPLCLVHGDLINTNIIRSKNNGIYLIDFSVSNYWPRIIEPAVLLCNVLFDQENINKYNNNYNLTVELYKKELGLSDYEIEMLPLFIKLAHAMHIIGATRERIKNNNLTAENKYWLNQGRIGLKTVNFLR